MSKESDYKERKGKESKKNSLNDMEVIVVNMKQNGQTCNKLRIKD